MGHGEGRKHSVKHRARSLSMVAFGEGRKRVRMHSRVGGEMKASYNANIHNGGRKVKKAKREMSHAQQMYQDKLKMIRKKHNLSFKDALKHYAKLKHTV